MADVSCRANDLDDDTYEFSRPKLARTYDAIGHSTEPPSFAKLFEEQLEATERIRNHARSSFMLVVCVLFYPAKHVLIVIFLGFGRGHLCGNGCGHLCFRSVIEDIKNEHMICPPLNNDH